VAERTSGHRHRYEFNNDYRQRFRDHGMLLTGDSPDGNFVEIIELADHPWFLAVQFHPEFKSKPTAAHPVVRGVRASRPRPAPPPRRSLDSRLHRAAREPVMDFCP
jgi:CTP synthase (UTP-ammonia lyase)